MSPFAKFLVDRNRGARPSMERAVRPFVPVRALASDSGPALIQVVPVAGVFTWGEASNFDQVDAFEALSADPPRRRSSAAPTDQSVDAADVNYRLANSLERFDENGQIENINIQGPDLAADRRIMQRTPIGHRPDRAPRMTWIFDYSPVLDE